MKKILMLVCVSIFSFQMTAHGEYADPLKNPWIFTPEEYWPGSEPIEMEGITFKLKVPYNPEHQMFFDIWQMELAKDRGTNLVLHARTFEDTDASFVTAKDAIYKTVAVIKGEVEVFFGSCESPYTVRPRDTVLLIPGTPHKFRAKEDAVLMVYCYGNGVAKDENKNFIKAYFDEKAVDTFTALPKKEDLRCKAMKETIFLNPWDFPGPNYEIRPTLARGSIHSAIDHQPEEDRYLKVALFETNNLAEFWEFQYKNYDYYPHSHPNFLEIMLITHKKSTFWVGAGIENGQVDTSDPTFGDEDAEVKSPRRGDGVRVGPGYLIYMPPGVPHSMFETENGTIWFATCNPADVFTMIMGGYANDIYLPEDEKE